MTKPLTQEMADYYFEHKGLRCPYCKSNMVEGDSVEVGGDTAWQEITCNDCGAGWTDLYTFSGITGDNQEEFAVRKPYTIQVIDADDEDYIVHLYVELVAPNGKNSVVLKESDDLFAMTEEEYDKFMGQAADLAVVWDANFENKVDKEDYFDGTNHPSQDVPEL
jgi:hypothetical protein